MGCKIFIKLISLRLSEIIIASCLEDECNITKSSSSFAGGAEVGRFGLKSKDRPRAVFEPRFQSVLSPAKGDFAVLLPWSRGAFAPLSPEPVALPLSHHAVVCCCFSSERTHHWLWFPKVTEGYPPAPWWPRTLAKGQHKVYCFIKYGKDGYCMFLSESARLCKCDGAGLVPNPDKLKQRHDQGRPISNSRWSLRRVLFSPQSQPTQTALAFLKCESFSVF